MEFRKAFLASDRALTHFNRLKSTSHTRLIIAKINVTPIEL
jgi:hypothetical protein